MKMIDITHKRFGRLVVKRRVLRESKRTMWLCECDCGKLKVVDGNNLKNGHVSSCGCYRRQLATQKNLTHGMTKTKAYLAWRNLKSRCENIHDIRYGMYGGRGIAVCNEWRSFEGFYQDMGDAPEGMSIDRINNDGPYCKENCQWATNEEQCNNKSTNHVISFNGETRTMTQWARKIGIMPDTLERRINKLRMPIEKALTMPVSCNQH